MADKIKSNENVLKVSKRAVAASKKVEKAVGRVEAAVRDFEGSTGRMEKWMLGAAIAATVVATAQLVLAFVQWRGYNLLVP